jgi:hypothetical protein
MVVGGRWSFVRGWWSFDTVIYCRVNATACAWPLRHGDTGADTIGWMTGRVNPKQPAGSGYAKRGRSVGDRSRLALAGMNALRTFVPKGCTSTANRVERNPAEAGSVVQASEQAFYE